MLKYIILGLVQGITEFLPVSSSGHLVIMQKLFQIIEYQVSFFVVLHLGTILALLVFFFKEILKLLRNKELLFMVVIVTFITGAIGLFGKDFFESLFSSSRWVAAGLIFTGILLILTKRFHDNRRSILEVQDAVILGLAQGLAIIPGISRSGITISCLLFRKVKPGLSFRFSFLAAIPAILGATILEAKDIGLALKENFSAFSIGFIFSFLSGLFCLWILKEILLRAKLYYFGYYCIIVAIITLFAQ